MLVIEMLILNSNFFHYINEKEVLEISKFKSNSEEIAAELLKKAIASGSADNISIMVLKLN